MIKIRTALLGGAAMIALAAGSAVAPAQAQVQSPGWFGSLAGWWYPWASNGTKLKYEDTDSGSVKAGPGAGFGGRGYAGYRFSNPYDIAFGVQGTWLKKGKTANGTVERQAVSMRQNAWYWAGDAEVGYNGNDGKQFGYRLFLGARYAEFRQKMSGNESSDPLSSKDRFRGVGPRIGMSGAYRFAPDSNWSLFGDIAGAYLFGGHRAKNVNDTCFDNSNCRTDKSGASSWNAEGQLGISYDVAPNVNIAAGYRGEYWSSVGFGQIHEDGPDAFKNAHRLMHGPFVRVAYNIGAPRGVPMPMAAPAPVAQSTNAFIIFFDWDRSVLTPQARDTVKQAADQFKAKGNARVTLTGHADRSGSDQYNMALSLRRGAAAKDELVRNGVPANAIVIIGKGESQPLVPTADGVREPQNRRVEIVLQ